VGEGGNESPAGDGASDQTDGDQPADDSGNDGADVDNDNVSANDDTEPDDPVTDEDEPEEPADDGPCDEGYGSYAPPDAGSVWLISTRTFQPSQSDVALAIAGRGETVIMVRVDSDSSGDPPACEGAGEGFTVSFDGREVHIDGTVSSGLTRLGCSVHVAGTLAACGKRFFGAPFFDLTGDVSVRIGETAHELTGAQFAPVDDALRTEPCAVPVSSFAGALWQVTTTDVFAPFPVAADEEVLIGFEGTGETIEEGRLRLPAVDGEQAECSVNEGYEGTVHLDGERLGVDVRFDGADGSSCRVSFSGVRTDCAEPIGSGGGFHQLLRFDGEGTYSGSGGEGTINVLYATALQLYEDPGEEPGPG
jgi:hypothetical protein